MSEEKGSAEVLAEPVSMNAGMLENGTEEGKNVAVREKGHWLSHLMLFSTVVGGGIIFLVLFSGLPWCKGDAIFRKLSEYYEYAYVALGVAVLSTVVLLILDARFWGGVWKYVAWTLWGLTAVGYAVAALLATKVYIVAPIGLFLFGTPFVIMGMRQLLFKNMDTLSFLNTLQIALLVVAIGSLTLWIGWIAASDAWWSVETKYEFYLRMQCDITPLTTLLTNNLTRWEVTDILPGSLNTTGLSDLERDMLDNVLVGCVSAFMLWLLPFILSLWSVVFAGVLFFIVRTVEQARAAKDKAHAMDPIAQAFVMFIGLGLFGLWAAAGIAGAQMNLTNVVLALSFLGLILMGVVVTAVFGTNTVQEGLGSTPLGNRMLKSMKSDWMKAIMLMLISPLFLIYVLGSALTQLSRKLFPCTRRLKDKDKELIVTTRANRYIETVLQWNWTSVLTKALWLGIFFFLLVVGVVRVTTVFLSWLNVKLLPISLPVTTLIFLLVGILMFLNPFIPGVPVYVSGGIILVYSAQEAMGFWGAVCYTIGICFGLKMFAIFFQQKIIGEMFASKRVWIRRLVGVNSVEIRAIRVILLQPGMNFRKVSVLCGGPDWPVSVLTGILRLPLCAMLYGSLPVFFLIAPCVIAGSLMLRVSEGGIWGSLSTMSLAVATVTQSGAMLAAIHFIAKTIVEKEDELRQWPDDEEVLEHERVSEKREKLSAYISHWSRLDNVNRFLLAFSSICMVISCYIFQLFGSKCFVSFSVSDSIEEKLGNDVTNLVTNFGLFALCVFAFPCAYLTMFRFYIGRLVKNAEQAGLAVGEGDQLVSAQAADPQVLESNQVSNQEQTLGEVDQRVCCAFLSRNYFPCLSKN